MYIPHVKQTDLLSSYDHGKIWVKRIDCFCLVITDFIERMLTCVLDDFL